MKKFKVGFGRVNVTPDFPSPLGGYGSEKYRIHDRVLNEIYYTAVAITDENDKTLMLCSYDFSGCLADIRDDTAELVRQKLGIDPDYFHLSGTHTHSSVALGADNENVKKYRKKLPEMGLKACELALKDQKTAQIFIGETKTEALNFIRHYMREDGSITTDNYNIGKQFPPIKKHLATPDETVRLVKFVRQNEDGSEARDILIINWQFHNHMTGGSKITDLSADCVGSIRSWVESYHNCFVAYFQGCAGDLNEKSRIKTENRTLNYLEYGKMFADYVNAVYDEMTPVPTGKVVSIREEYAVKINRQEEDRLNDALRVVEYRGAHGVNDECKRLAIECGFHSPYHASAVVNRSKIPEDYYKVFLNAYRIGDIGWTSAPFEVFCKTGMEIRKNSPFAFTLTQGYTDGHNSYLPTKEAFDYGCYEADITKNGRGEAEAIGEKLVEMLNRIKDM